MKSAIALTLAAKALVFVPGGTVEEEREKEVRIKTPAGTMVEVEFERSGEFDEASGDNVTADVFTPAQGLSLQAAVESLKKAGKEPRGSWSYENDFWDGWHYEFEGTENGREMDYVVDAKSGNLLKSKIDD